jgi:phospholipid/cholesterol/gamma-HCH transport system substrate-binding protein
MSAQDSGGDRKLEIQVGIVFVLAVLILVFGVMWFKNYSFRSTYARVTIVFPSTSGLLKGDPVEVAGVPSGQVQAIRQEDAHAVVEVDLKRDVHLYASVHAVLENSGIMGQKLIEIYPGSGRPIPLEGATLQGEYQPGVSELMGNLAETFQKVNRIATTLDTLLSGITAERRGAMANTLDNLESASADLADFLRRSRGDLVQSVHEFRLAMEDVHETLEGHERTIGQVIDRTDRLTARLDSTAARLDSSLAMVQEVISQVHSGEGTVGKLIEDDALYDQLTETVKETRALVQDIKNHPKKYVKLSLF